jgi:hypothetical protein
MEVDFQEDVPCLQAKAEARVGGDGWVAVAVRPYNPEGIQFIDRIEFEEDDRQLRVDRTKVILGEVPEKVIFSTYEEGDVFHKLEALDARAYVTCPVGMATAAVLFPVSPRSPKVLCVTVPLDEAFRREFPLSRLSSTNWTPALDGAARLTVPDPAIQFLFDAAVRTLILLSSREIVPGPFTYRRFWFRDACLMTHVLLLLGFRERCRGLLTDFLSRQKRSGYFQSQGGEWDSNGQVLWILDRFQRLTGNPFPVAWIKAVMKGADWIIKKRIPKEKDSDHAGLLPPGFSAEHFGPNDYYYWDDFWGVGGLRGAARIVSRFHSEEEGRRLLKEAVHFEKTIFASIASIPEKRRHGAIPASPHRRMDAGAIGSLVADYPLQLLPGGDPRIMRTAEFLMSHCFQSGGFFQDMIHSGINAYMTLSIAESLLRAGDPRYRELIRTVADLATPTGQWPEAIHPLTGGGCMGDGQHGWAAAEWVTIVRNLFVREEPGRLILGSGIFPEWLETSGELHFGPTLTSYGPVSVKITRSGSRLLLDADIDWTSEPAPVDIQVPGYEKETTYGPHPSCELEPEKSS